MENSANIKEAAFVAEKVKIFSSTGLDTVYSHTMSTHFDNETYNTQLREQTCLTITELVTACPDILDIIMRTPGHLQWSLIATCKPFYELYLQQAMRIPSSLNGIAPLSYEHVKALRCSMAPTSWGPLQYNEILDLEKFNIKGPIMAKAAYLKGIDILLCGFFDLKFRHSLTHLVLRNVFLSDMKKIFSECVSLRYLVLEECYSTSVLKRNIFGL